MARLLVKTLLYLALISAAALSFHKFYLLYQEKSAQAARRFDFEETETLRVSGSTNAETATNPPLSQARESGTNALPEKAATEPETVAGPTNPPPETAPGGKPAQEPSGSLGLYGFLGVLSILALAFLVGHDVSSLMGSRFHKLVFDEDGKGLSDSDYEKAEAAWAQGNYLEAIQLLRQFLERYPRRVYAKFRIAEIYEKDLGNTIAAALEYEEILKQRFDPERWAWAAIHLCNLYYHLNEPAKAKALLQRIAREFPDTAAAQKARKRLAEMGSPVEEPAPSAAKPAEKEESGPKLPPGFRPKK